MLEFGVLECTTSRFFPEICINLILECPTVDLKVLGVSSDIIESVLVFRVATQITH